MQSISRTKNVVRNMFVGTLSQVLSLLLSFASRTVFIYVLGVEYLGVNGLFTNILMILSFAELGIGNAIIFSMYKPLAEDDKIKLEALMNLYATAYKIIGAVITVVGLAIIPFMDLIIKDAPNIPENLIIIYLFFLSDTVLSYFFAYRKAIITADQKNYIVVLYDQVFMFIKTVGQIAVLLITHDYIMFLVIQIICTFTSNVLIALKATSLYPYLKEKTGAKISKDERRIIFANVRALFMYQLGSVALNGTSNIIISAIIGIAAVGLCSNYLLIIVAVESILGQIMRAFTASVGNLNALTDHGKKQTVFEQLNLISVWLYGFCSIALILFSNDFIELWIGRDYLLSTYVLLAMVLHFYIHGVQFAPFTYRTTMGLFVQGRYAPVIAALLNVILSILFANAYGIAGVFLAMAIARLLTVGLVDPCLVYKIGFKSSPTRYFIKYVFYGGLVVVNFTATKFFLDFINVDSWLGLIIKAFACLFLTNIIFVLMFYKTQEFKSLKQILISMVGKLRNGMSNK